MRSCDSRSSRSREGSPRAQMAAAQPVTTDGLENRRRTKPPRHRPITTMSSWQPRVDPAACSEVVIVGIHGRGSIRCALHLAGPGERHTGAPVSAARGRRQPGRPGAWLVDTARLTGQAGRWCWQRHSGAHVSRRLPHPGDFAAQVAAEVAAVEAALDLSVTDVRVGGGS